MISNRTFCIAILAALLSALPTMAQPDQWEKAGGNLGLGTIDGIVSTRSGVLFTSSGTGIYRSTDDGGRWEHIVPGWGVSVLKIAPDGSLFAGTSGGLYRSTDLGESWETYGDRKLITDIAFSAGTDVLVISDKSLYRLLSHGTDWHRLTTPGAPTVSYPRVARDKLGRIYIWNGTAVYRSTGGVEWTLLASSFDLDGFAVDSAGRLFVNMNRRMHRSTDDGATWKPLDSMRVQSLDVGPSDEVIARASDLTNPRSTHVGLMLSTDAGDTWRSIYAAVTHAVTIAQDGDIYAAAQYRILRSTDRGSTWHERSRGFEDNFGSLIRGVDGDLYASAATGLVYRHPGTIGIARLYRTTDDGESWEPLKDSIVGKVSVTPDGTIYAAEGAVKRSGSDTWDSVFSTIIRSTDRGRTWTRSTTLSGTLGPVVDLGNGILVAGHLGQEGPQEVGDGIMRSTDNGITWRPAGLRSAVLRIERAPDGTLYVPMGYHYSGKEDRDLYRSTDDGATWTGVWKDMSITGFTIAADGTLFAGGFESPNHTLYRSEDRGATWTRLRNVAGSSRIVIDGAGTLYVSFTSSGSHPPQLIRSTDRGQTWTVSLDSASIDQILPDQPGGTYVVVDDFENARVLRSTDRGLSWDSVMRGLGPVSALSLESNGRGRLFAHTSIGYYRTTAAADAGPVASVPIAGVKVHPNPFHDVTMLALTLDRRERVRVDLVDRLGRVVARLHDGVVDAGEVKVPIDGNAVGGGGIGVFFCRVQCGGTVTTVPVTVVR